MPYFIIEPWWIPWFYLRHYTIYHCYPHCLLLKIHWYRCHSSNPSCNISHLLCYVMRCCQNWPKRDPAVVPASHMRAGVTSSYWWCSRLNDAFSSSVKYYLPIHKTNTLSYCFSVIWFVTYTCIYTKYLNECKMHMSHAYGISLIN